MCLDLQQFKTRASATTKESFEKNLRTKLSFPHLSFATQNHPSNVTHFIKKKFFFSFSFSPYQTTQWAKDCGP